jgi:hypothetical protein
MQKRLTQLRINKLLRSRRNRREHFQCSKYVFFITALFNVCILGAQYPDNVVAQIAKQVYEYIVLATCRPQELPTYVPAQQTQQQATPETVLQVSFLLNYLLGTK